MKKYNGLLMAFLVGFSVNLIASQETKKSFVESTKDGLGVVAIVYGAGYAFAHGVGTLGFALAHAHIEADFERWDAKQKGEKISFKKTANTFAKEFKDAFGYVNKRIIQSHRVAAPVVLGGIVANNLYKQAHS